MPGSILDWVPAETDPDTKIWVQVVCDVIPGRNGEEWRSETREEGRRIQRVLTSRLSPWAMELHLTWDDWETVIDVPQSCPTRTVLPTSSPPSRIEAAEGGISGLPCALAECAPATREGCLGESCGQLQWEALCSERLTSGSSNGIRTGRWQ